MLRRYFKNKRMRPKVAPSASSQLVRTNVNEVPVNVNAVLAQSTDEVFIQPVAIPKVLERNALASVASAAR